MKKGKKVKTPWPQPKHGISTVTGLPKCKDCDNDKLNGWSSHCKRCQQPIVF